MSSRSSTASPAAAAPTSRVPSAITDADRRRVTAAEARRLASLVEAAWIVFDRVAAGAPPVLRKGRAVAVATATR